MFVLFEGACGVGLLQLADGHWRVTSEISGLAEGTGAMLPIRPGVATR